MEGQSTPSQLEFHALGRRKVVGKFDEGTITSDAGGLLTARNRKTNGNHIGIRDVF